MLSNRTPSKAQIAGRVVLAIAAVGAVAGLAWLVDADLTVAALLLLATVLVVATMGFAPGLAAAFVAFLLLTYLFTEPTGSFKIHRTDDVVALIVFAVAAALVGWIVQRLSHLSRVAQRRENEARLRLDLTNRLIAGADVDEALDGAAAAFGELFGFATCTLVAGDPSPPDSENLRVEAPGVTLLARCETELTPSDRALVEALVAGLAVSVDRLRLQQEVRTARLFGEVSRQRAGFLSAISHNLRTPLTAVKAAASTLLGSWSRIDPEERRELLELICDESERLERLVRNTLELSRIRAGALEVEREQVDIADLVQHAVRRLRPIARAHRVRLDVAPKLPPVALDVTMAEQIFLNLLENALRFAPPGSEIVVGAHAVDGDEVEVRISDHGPGVPVDARDRIFEEFQSADDRPDHSGTGLGLAIVRALVLAHGGSVRYEETSGGGATFVCTFPLEAQAMEAQRS